MSSFVQRLPFAPIVSLLFGATAAFLVVAMPGWRFEQIVSESGLATYLAAAEPPLGIKARVLGALAAALVVSLGLFLILNPLISAAERRRQPVEIDPLPMDAFGRLGRTREGEQAGQGQEDEPNLPRFLRRESLAESVSESAYPSHGESGSAHAGSAVPLFLQPATPDVTPAAPVLAPALSAVPEEAEELLLDATLAVPPETPPTPVESAHPAPAPQPVAVAPAPVPSSAAAFDPAACPFLGAIAERASEATSTTTDALYMRQPDPVLIIEPAPVQPPVAPPRPHLVAQREPSVAELMERFEQALKELQRNDRPAGDEAMLRRAMTQLEVLVAAGGR